MRSNRKPTRYGVIPETAAASTFAYYGPDTAIDFIRGP
jgi:hypothetical protein